MQTTIMHIYLHLSTSKLLLYLISMPLSTTSTNPQLLIQLEFTKQSHSTVNISIISGKHPCISKPGFTLSWPENVNLWWSELNNLVSKVIQIKYAFKYHYKTIMMQLNIFKNSLNYLLVQLNRSLIFSIIWYLLFSFFWTRVS